MEKNKNKKSSHDSDDMSDQIPGSSLYIKSHQDFNNEHPEQIELGVVKGNSNPDETNKGNDNSQTSDIKKSETKNREKEATVTYTCSMHPEVISDKPGKCPKCGMELIEV